MRNEVKNCDPEWGGSEFKRTQQLRDAASARDSAILSARIGLDQVRAKETVVNAQKELVNPEKL